MNDQYGEVLRQVQTLFDEGTAAGLTDGQLLERFAARHGAAPERAFAALVERHGPMVLRVCRAALRDEHEAHDAFQATFLVLVRQARSLWVRDSEPPDAGGLECRGLAALVPSHPDMFLSPKFLVSRAFLGAESP